MGGQPGQDGHPVFLLPAQEKNFSFGLGNFFCITLALPGKGGGEEGQAPSW